MTSYSVWVKGRGRPTEDQITAVMDDLHDHHVVFSGGDAWDKWSMTITVEAANTEEARVTGSLLAGRSAALAGIDAVITGAHATPHSKIRV